MCATNFFFRQYHSRNEQELLEDLTIEAIKAFGEDVLYLPCNLTNYDLVYGASDQKQYTWAIPIEMFITTPYGFGGDQEFFTKFGPEIRNQIKWSVAMRRFYEEVGQSAVLVRPRENDLIYFPQNQRVYIIREVTKYENFYQLGALQTWEMTCENFEFSDEVVQTGVWEIDRLQTQHSTNLLDWAILTQDNNPIRTQDGHYLVLEKWQEYNQRAEDDELVSESDQIIQFSVLNPFCSIEDTNANNVG